MRGSWQKVVDSLLRPARPELARCLAERESHRAARRPIADERARAMRDCERRIELARAAVFAANDGVISAGMTDLEREWRKLSRPDLDGSVMDLWARVAPPAWIDRKRFRDSDAEDRFDAAIALAADVDGVLVAESAIEALRVVLAAWGTPIGARIIFRMSGHDSEHNRALLEAPLRVAREAAAHDDLARRFEREVHDATLARFPERPLLARDVAHAAFVDCLFHAAELGERPHPVVPLIDLWMTGYVISSVDAAGVTLEVPQL